MSSRPGMKSATRLTKVDTRATPNSEPHPSMARTWLDVQEFKLVLSASTRQASISGRSPLSSSGCSTNGSKNSCCAIQVPNHLERDSCSQSCPALIVACSNSASRPVNRRCSDLSYQTIQTRPAGGVSASHGNWTCLVYAPRISSNALKFWHPQGSRHRLANGYLSHISRRANTRQANGFRSSQRLECLLWPEVQDPHPAGA